MGGLLFMLGGIEVKIAKLLRLKLQLIRLSFMRNTQGPLRYKKLKESPSPLR